MDGLIEPIALKKNRADYYVPSILAIGFLIIYSVIQIYCLLHIGSEDDIISVRLQDILIMIVSYYFGSSQEKLKVGSN